LTFVDVTQQLRHIPARARRHRHGQVRAVHVAGQQLRLRDDLGTVPREVDGHAHITSDGSTIGRPKIIATP
jgi:hypothetical protein